MSDEAGTETVGADAPAVDPTPPAAAPARPPFIDGLGPILLGAVWLLGSKLVELFLPQILTSLETTGRILLIDETRSVVMSQAGAAVLMFAGFARAAAPWAAGRDALSLRWLGKGAFGLLLLSFAAWLLLSLSFLIPGLWPNLFGGGEAAQAFAIPAALYWADFGVLTAFYASMVLFAAQILATLGTGLLRGDGLVGPAALGLAVASLLALYALPDDVRHQWLSLTEAAPAAGDVLEEQGLAGKAINRVDGRFYVFDQISFAGDRVLLTGLDFVAFLAALGVLSIAVWRGAGGRPRWSFLASLGVLAFGIGAWFAVNNVGFAHPATMVRALRFAAVLCSAGLVLTGVAAIVAVAFKGARRGVPAFWAMGTLIPTAIAVIATPWIAQSLEQVEDRFDFWTTAFISLDGLLIVFAAFAGWYALQHRLTGRETSRFWSVAHLVVAFLISAGAVFGDYYKVYFNAGFEMATASLDEVGKGATFFGVLSAVYLVFLLGLLLARRRLFSRFEPASSTALGAASRAASAAKPKETFKSTTLFGGGAAEESSQAQEDGAASEKPEQSGVAAPAQDAAPLDPGSETAAADGADQADAPSQDDAAPQDAVPQDVAVVVGEGEAGGKATE